MDISQPEKYCYGCKDAGSAVVRRVRTGNIPSIDFFEYYITQRCTFSIGIFNVEIRLLEPIHNVLYHDLSDYILKKSRFVRNT